MYLAALVEYNLVFHLINIEVVFSNAKCFKFGIKCLSNVFIVQAAGEEVFFGLRISMGTVWADTALFGQPVLVISAILCFLLFLCNRLDHFLVVFL